VNALIIKNIYSFILIITLIISIYCFLYSFKRRNVPGAKCILILLVTIFIYNGAYLLELNSTEFSTALFWYYIEHISIPIQPYIWLLISLDYIGVAERKKRIIKSLGLIHPILYYLAFYSNQMFKLYDLSYSFKSNGYFKVIYTEKGISYHFLVVTGTALMVTIIMLYLTNYTKTSKMHRYNFAIMILASIFPWLSVYFFTSSWNTLKLDYAPVTLIISEAFYMFGIFRFSIMDAVPIAHKIVFEQSKDGVLILDLNDNIIDANNTFKRLFPQCSKKWDKNTFEVFLAENPEINRNIIESSNKPFTLKFDGESQHCCCEMVEISQGNSSIIGRMLVISDVTLFVENQKKLETVVINAMQKAETNEVSFLQAQIKPHFLNNTLSLITSLITREPTKAKEMIVNLSEYLMNCYQFDMSAPLIPLCEELDFLKTYVEIEKARFMERLQVKIICDDVPCVKVPRLILQPLVENSIKHGVLTKSEGGTVELKISQNKSEITLEVSDDGVGIERERIPLLLDGADSRQGVGIINIHKRLISHYGKGLDIKSYVGFGTRISFSIPTSINLKEEDENDKCYCG